MIDSNKLFVDDSLALLHQSGLPITMSEEHDLFVAYKNESDAVVRCALRDKLTRANVRYVISVARGYTNESQLLQELVSCGNMGLLEAIDRFDPDAGVKFISYSVWYIKKYMLDYMYENSTIYVPRDQLIKLRRELMENPDNPNIDVDVWSARNMVSLDAPVESDDGNATSVGDLIIDSNQLNEHESTESNKHNQWLLDNILGDLDQKEMKIIDLFYGLSDDSYMTDREISETIWFNGQKKSMAPECDPTGSCASDKIKLSRERVRQIRVDAIKKLKLRALKNNRLQ